MARPNLVAIIGSLTQNFQLPLVALKPAERICIAPSAQQLTNKYEAIVAKSIHPVDQHLPMAELFPLGLQHVALAGTLLALAREPGYRFGMCGALVDYSFPIERSAASLEQAYSWLGEICFDRQPWMRGSASPEIRAGRVS